MKDSYGRSIDYLRISLTDKCNLRCRYCMPKCGVKSVAHADILRFEEIERVVRIMAGLGVKKVRLTGGEPLVRKNITSLISSLASVRGIEELSMTTNGCLLGEMAKELYAAGLKSINVSLDTLDPAAFTRLTGVDALHSVLEGIDAALACGMKVKLNCVPVKDVNDKELTRIARYGVERGIPVRFIELMPLGPGAEFTGIATDDIIGGLSEEFKELKPEAPEYPGAPAVYYKIESTGSVVGFISPMSHKFCAYCSRIRLTAAGYLKLCLQYPDGVDLKGPLRDGVDDKGIKRIIRSAVYKKPKAHSFGSTGNNDNRDMYEIGG